MIDLRRSLQKRSILFYWTSIVLLAALVLYPLLGSLILVAVLQVAGADPSTAWFDEEFLAPVRIVQAAGQVLLLLLPVFFLVALQTGRKQVFETLRFLGLLSRPSAAGFFLALAGMLLLQPSIYLMMEGISALLPFLGETGRYLMEDQERLERFLLFLAGADSIPEFLVVSFVIAIVPACCEEVLFRGYFLRNYVRALSPAGGVLLTGFVFGLFHLSPVNLVPLTVMGCYLGFVYYRTGSLLVPVAVHFLNNMFSLVLLQVQRRSALSALPEIPPESAAAGFWLLLLVVSLALLALVLYRLGKLRIGGGAGLLTGSSSL